MDCGKLFDSMFPGFFNEPGIKNIPGDRVFAELVMDLRRSSPEPVPYPCPDHISFGVYHGEIERIKEAVARVDEEWLPYYCEGSRVFCAFDRDTVASFCILEDWGRQDGLLIGGPGCVGTVPEYRKMGIGLEMVSRATNILKENGFDISWIHYTHIWPWYEKLGYRTVLRWSSSGILSA